MQKKELYNDSLCITYDYCVTEARGKIFIGGNHGKEKIQILSIIYYVSRLINAIWMDISIIAIMEENNG